MSSLSNFFNENASFGNLSVLTALTSSHHTNSSAVEWLTEEDETQVLCWTILTAVLCVVGTILNILVLIATLPRQSDKSGLNFLIFYFVFMNLFMCIVNIPIRLVMVQVRQAGYIAPRLVCLVLHPVYMVGLQVINWVDVCLSANRTIALYFPHQYKYWSTTRVNVCAVTFTWCLCIASVLPGSFGKGGFMTAVFLGHCAYWATDHNLSNYFYTVLYTPYAMTGFLSLLMLWKTYDMSRSNFVQPDRQSDVGSNHQPGHGRQVQRRVRMAKTLLLTFLWTVVCNVPSYVIISKYAHIFVQHPVAFVWVQTFTTCQYGFTPCILLLCNAQYRDRVKRMLKRSAPSVDERVNCDPNGAVSAPKPS